MKLALNQWIIYKPFTSKCSVGKLFAVVLKIFAHFFAFFMRTLQIMIGIHFRKSTYPHFLLLVNVFVLCRSESDKRPIISEMNDWNEKFHGWDGTEPNQPKKKCSALLIDVHIMIHVLLAYINTFSRCPTTTTSMGFAAMRHHTYTYPFTSSPFHHCDASMWISCCSGLKMQMTTKQIN